MTLNYTSHGYILTCAACGSGLITPVDPSQPHLRGNPRYNCRACGALGVLADVSSCTAIQADLARVKEVREECRLEREAQ